MSEVAVLFSGGTDSTCTAVMAAQQHDRVHLLTMRRYGMFGVEKSDTNFHKIAEMFGEDRFVRPDLMGVDRLFRHLSYGTYFRDLRRHGLMNLTTCGVCKLTMHTRAVVYCLQNGVDRVWDGANRNMYIFPAQMEGVMGLLRDMYARYGIEYENPVFEFEDPQGMNFGSRVYGLNPAREETADRASQSTGEVLRGMGILPSADVKGTEIDREMQARCYQFVLFNVFARWYFLERYDYAEYARRVQAFYDDKVAVCTELLDTWRETGNGQLTGMLE